jgi:hypothetical protein
MKDVQAIGKAFSPKKITSSTSKHEILELFPNFVGHFCPPGSGSGAVMYGYIAHLPQRGGEA